MSDVESSVIGLINGSSGWVTNTNLFRGPVLPSEANETPIPIQACFVRFTGGPEPLNLCSGTAAEAPQENTFNVQVIVRGTPDKFGTTRTLAAATRLLLHDVRPSGYFDCRCTTSEPVWLGQDERRNHLFVINLRMRNLE